jgi:3-phosphoshikimate 1-carboxyvinyltransferase
LKVVVNPTSSVSGELALPPSKSYAHRALFLALLASGRTELKPRPVGEDVEATADVVAGLGASIVWEKDGLVVESEELRWTPSLYSRESGTTLRIAMAVASLLDRPVLVYGSGRMERRPVRGLAEALSRLGVSVLLSNECCPPVAVKGPVVGSRTYVNAGESSQYLTALLVMGAAVGDGLEVEVLRLSSKGYVDVTCRVLNWYGVRVDREGYSYFRVLGPPKPTRVLLPGDWSSAAPFIVLATAMGAVRLHGLDLDDPQPDRRVLELARAIGATVKTSESRVEITSTGTIEAFNVCINDYPDLGPFLAVLAATACGTSKICCASRLRLKESDRFSAILDLLDQLRVDSYPKDDCIVVKGVCGRRATITKLVPPPDHRMVMAAAVGGLLLSSTRFVVEHANAVNKSYPGFWDDLRKLGVSVEYRAAGLA